MTLGHALGETLAVGIFRFLSDLAELALRHAAGRGLPDKGLVFLVQRIFGGSRSSVAGLPGLGKTKGSREQSNGYNGGRSDEGPHHCHPREGNSPVSRRGPAGTPHTDLPPLHTPATPATS